MRLNSSPSLTLKLNPYLQEKSQFISGINDEEQKKNKHIACNGENYGTVPEYRKIIFSFTSLRSSFASNIHKPGARERKKNGK